MDTNRLLNTVGFAGKLLIQSGAEIYRVEETMVRLCKSFVEVQDADSFVTPTGIMFSITVNDQTFTKIMRVHSRSVDLNCIDKINALSRKASVTPYTLEELETELDEIRKQTRYSFLVTMLFGAIGAAGFAIFFDGTWKEAICAFIIGIFIKCVCWCLEKIQLNSFFVNAVSAGVAAFIAVFLHLCFHDTDMDIMIISSIMLLVPGLAITNAVRDTVAGDYLSGVARATEAILVAIAIAVGVGFVLSISLRLGGM